MNWRDTLALAEGMALDEGVSVFLCWPPDRLEPEVEGMRSYRMYVRTAEGRYYSDGHVSEELLVDDDCALFFNHAAERCRKRYS